MIRTAASLASLKLAQLKVIAAELNVIPDGNKSRKQIWIDAILAVQVVEEISAAIESVQPIEVPQAAVSLKPIQPQSPVIIALVAILAVVTMVRAVVIVGVFGINLTVRGADVLIRAWHRWSERLPKLSMIPVPA